jgi:hypothetical protein
VKTVVFAFVCLVGCEPGKLRLGDMATTFPDLTESPTADLGEMADLSQPAVGSPTHYPSGQLHSAITPYVKQRALQILASGANQREVFAKVGDSITADPNFATCLGSTSDLDLQASAGAEPTRAYFAATQVEPGKNSFNRTSKAAGVSWHPTTVLAGSPSPIEEEVTAIRPGFAVVMLGTNDTEACCIEGFASNMTRVVDDLIGRGVVPILSSIPPRGDSATVDAIVPEMNAALLAIAKHKQIPYMDYWQLLDPLPSFDAANPKYGMAPDGVHPQVYVSSGVHGCWFTPAALDFGVNQRNQLLLDSLHRVKTIIVDDGPADPTVTSSGAGTFTDPIVVDALPFVDANDTTTSSSSVADVYSCATQNEGGPEIVYRVNVSAAATLRARVFTDSGVDVDVHWLSGPSKDMCISRNDKLIDLAAQPGTYYLAADTFVSAGAPRAGAYRLTIVALP